MKTREDLNEDEVMMTVAGYADQVRTNVGWSVDEVSAAIDRMNYFNERRRLMLALDDK